MKRNSTFIYGLIAFFLLWIVFGVAAYGPRETHAAHLPIPPQQNVSEIAESRYAAGIPVTSEPQLAKEMLLNDGLAGLAALAMIMIVLDAANKPIVYAGHEDLSDSDLHK